jgi:3-hydroxymyristoyl/3-hydroxydecanoyl-(acyl carrier protein) dehydratase
LRWKLIDHIDDIDIGSSAQGRVCFDPELPLFGDHFPRFPVVPGVLILESLAQLSGKLIGYTVRRQTGRWPFPILSMMEKVKFRRFVRPGQAIRLESKLIHLREDMGAVRVKASCEHGDRWRVHAQAEQIFAFQAVPLEDSADEAAVEQIERDELARLWPNLPPEDA